MNHKQNIFKVVLALSLLSQLLSCKTDQEKGYYSMEELRSLYSQPNTDQWPTPTLDSLIDVAQFRDLGTLPEVHHPKDNSYSFEKKQLGKALFFDPRISQSGQIACASCHHPELGWTDNLTRSFGHNRQTSKRNAMTILNAAYAHELFWDGRAESLEDQARFPIPDKTEMNANLDLATKNIAGVKGYATLFSAAFGDSVVSIDRMLKAIAVYERSLVSPPSKFDKFINGKKDLFTDQELLGLHLFRTKARCINCHNTAYFSDNQYHNDGQTLFGSKDEDFGRYYVTGRLEDLGRFRTPTLREIGRTGPYMHHGHFRSLKDVIDLYNLGNPAPIQKKYLGIGRDSLIPTNSPLLQELSLTEEEIQAVIAFLHTLSTKTQRVNLNIIPE